MAHEVLRIMQDEWRIAQDAVRAAHKACCMTRGADTRRSAQGGWHMSRGAWRIAYGAWSIAHRPLRSTSPHVSFQCQRTNGQQTLVHQTCRCTGGVHVASANASELQIRKATIHSKRPLCTRIRARWPRQHPLQQFLASSAASATTSRSRPRPRPQP